MVEGEWQKTQPPCIEKRSIIVNVLLSADWLNLWMWFMSADHIADVAQIAPTVLHRKECNIVLRYSLNDHNWFRWIPSYPHTYTCNIVSLCVAHKHVCITLYWAGISNSQQRMGCEIMGYNPCWSPCLPICRHTDEVWRCRQYIWESIYLWAWLPTNNQRHWCMPSKSVRCIIESSSSQLLILWKTKQL